MSLDAAKLEKARELAGGIVQARCPACAENGGLVPRDIESFLPWNLAAERKAAWRYPELSP